MTTQIMTTTTNTTPIMGMMKAISNGLLSKDTKATQRFKKITSD